MVIARGRSRRSNLLIAAAMLVAACSPEPPVDEGPRDPVVVYVAFDEDPALTALLERYREETGVVVINRHGSSQAIVDDLIRNDVMPPADLLMTRSAFDVWRASEESALRPVFSETLRERIPAWARDADDLWFATSADVAVIAYNSSHSEGASIASFAALANAAHGGKLCLPSSKVAISRAVVALMISELGKRDAELAVRNWVQNLASPPFASEAELAAAIASGECAVGFVSQDAASSIDSLRFNIPDATIATVDAIGVGRHARNPDGAAQMLEWLVEVLPPIGGDAAVIRDASTAAWNDEEARLLVERARYH